MRNTNKMHAGRQMTQVAAKNSEGTLPGGNTVLVELDGGIAWVSMHRPDKRNCISPTLASEMLAVLNALEADKRCQIVVLTGTGDSFSAGMDLKEFFRDKDTSTPPGARPRRATSQSRRVRKTATPIAPHTTARASPATAARPPPWASSTKRC